MHGFFQDVRHAFRMMRKNPGYTLVAILALAIGIGANSAEFVGVNAMLLRPLPFKNLDKVVAVWTTMAATHDDRVSVTPADFRAWHEQATAFEGLAAGHGWDANLTGNGLPERLEGYQVTGDFFRMLGTKPSLGRILDNSDQQPGQSRVVVLSYRAWKNRFASDAAIVGKSITLNGQAMSVVGVMPRDFDYPFGTAVWAPLALTPEQLADRNNGYLKIVGRIRPGVSLAEAQAQMNTIAARLAGQFPDTNAGHGVRVVTVVRDLNEGSRQFILILMSAAGFVLLLACANIANLQLARATARRRELALRTALGASRGRLIRQMLIESQILGIAGGAVGLLFAVWANHVTRDSLPPFILDHIAGLQHLEVDGSVVAFTGVVALLAGLISGILPAVQGSFDARLHDVLKEAGRSASGGSRHRLRAVLVVSEVTLALVLLIGSGLLVSGFRSLARVDQGFDPSNILTFRVVFPHNDYPEATHRRAAYDAIAAKLQSIPGVESVTPISSVPSGWNWNRSYLGIAGAAPLAPGEVRITYTESAGPDFVRVFRLPLVRGREFSRSDGPDTQPVAIVSSSLVAHYWPHSDPVGRRIKLGTSASDPWRTIVGVVGNIRVSSFDKPQDFVYTPVSQEPPPSTYFAVRTSGDPLAIATAVRTQVAAVEPTLPVFDIRTQEQIISDNISGVQFSARTMIAFGILALLLAAAGIYAVMSYSVAQRTHEIGVRMALGARPSDVLGMVVRYTLKLTAIGIAIGLPLAFAVSRFLGGFLFGVVHAGTAVFTVFPAILAAVALLAGYIPARWATRVDPLEALRCE